MPGDERPDDRETRRDFLRLSLVPALGAAAPSLFASDVRGATPPATETVPTEGAPEMGVTKHKTQDIGVAKQINDYSDAVEVKPNLRWLYTSGTPALTEAGELPPDITGQAELAWILADDFTASLPDYKLRDREQFLELIAAPRPFTELAAHDVKIRLLGDFAIIHAALTFRTLDGVLHHGRYTDDWQRRAASGSAWPRTSSPRTCNPDPRGVPAMPILSRPSPTGVHDGPD